MKVSIRTGRLENTRIIRCVNADASFPITMSTGRIFVVNISSSVWRSRSPLMLADVSAGMMNISIINSRAATNV